jgi:hypothetical protein
MRGKKCNEYNENYVDGNGNGIVVLLLLFLLKRNQK